MNRTNLGPVAVIGADSPIGLTVVRELGEHGVDVVALGRSGTSISRNSRYVSRFEVLQRPLAKHLPAQLERLGICAAFAISENDLIELAPLKEKLANCQLLTPVAEQLSIVLDKRQTLEHAEKVGISVPPSWQPEKGENFKEKAAAQKFPVAIKWANPEAVLSTLFKHEIALEKVEYAASPDELLTILSRYDAIGQWPLVQYRCPEYGLGQMFHMHQGEATLTFQHRRLREWPPTGGVSSFCEAVPLDAHADQQQLSIALLKEIGWDGPAMVEYRYDPETGRYWLMEINGRFWGSLPLAYHCGVHFAWEALRCRLLDGVPTKQKPYRMRKARYLIPDAKHLASVLRDPAWSLSRKLGTLWGFAAGFFSPREHYYLWNTKDPRPFVDDIAQVIGKVFRR